MKRWCKLNKWSLLVVENMIIEKYQELKKVKEKLTESHRKIAVFCNIIDIWPPSLIFWIIPLIQGSTLTAHTTTVKSKHQELSSEWKISEDGCLVPDLKGDDVFGNLLVDLSHMHLPRFRLYNVLWDHTVLHNMFHSGKANNELFDYTHISWFIARP